MHGGGGVWCTIFPDWCKPGAEVGPGHFLCMGWSVHGNKKMVLEINFFGAGNQFFGAGNHFFGENLVLEIHCLGFGNFDETS